MRNKILLFQSTNTQRLTLTKENDGSCLLSKDWRKNSNENWIQGKGIKIPTQYVVSIGKLLASQIDTSIINECGFEYINDDEERVYTSERAEKRDFTTNTKKTYSWRETYTNYRQQNPLGRNPQKIY